MPSCCFFEQDSASDGFLSQGELCMFALGDIANCRKVHGLSIELKEAVTDFNRKLSTALAEAHAFIHQVPLRAEPLHHRRINGPSFTGRDFVGTHPKKLFARIFKALTGDVVHFNNRLGATVIVEFVDEDGIVDAVEKQAIALFTFPQCLFDELALGDVAVAHAKVER